MQKSISKIFELDEVDEVTNGAFPMGHSSALAVGLAVCLVALAM